MRAPRSVGALVVETTGRYADPLPGSLADWPPEALVDVAEPVALPHEAATPIRADLERLQHLRPDDPERLRLRQHVVESHLPLVRALANRYRDQIGRAHV